MHVKPPAHSLTHTPAVPKKKNRVEGRVEHATRDVRVYLLLEKSNACSLLLLPLHVRCFLSAALVRRMVVVAQALGRPAYSQELHQAWMLEWPRLICLKHNTVFS